MDQRDHLLSVSQGYELQDFQDNNSSSSIPPSSINLNQSPYSGNRSSFVTSTGINTGINTPTTAPIGGFPRHSRKIIDTGNSIRTSGIGKMAYPQLYVNRYSFGFEKLNVYPILVRWRFSDVVLCLLLGVIFFASWKFQVQPFQRQFFINDLTISHPFAEHQRVSDGALFFVSFVIPTVVITVLSLVFTSLKNKMYVLFVSLLGLYISLFTNSIITEVLKVWIGRHRPDFLSRCIVREGTPINTMVFAQDVCTTTDIAKLMDGFKTTPSGHSSISFSGLGYLSLWLCGQFLVSHVDTGAWRSIVSGLPLFGASYVAFSRTEDYRHHFVDVILGSCLGSLVAWWSYRRIFPRVTDEYCFLPYQLIEEEKLLNGGNVPYHLPNGYELANQSPDDINTI